MGEVSWNNRLIVIKWLKNNNTIVIAKTDRGNVNLDKDEYEYKIEEHLNTNQRTRSLTETQLSLWRMK